MKKKLTVTVLLMSLMLLLLPTVTVKAEEQEVVEVGAQSIEYEGEIYELYAVEYSYPVCAMAEEENSVRMEEEATIYRYRSVGDNDLTVVDKSSNTYGSDGVLIATVRQITEWYYVDGSRVDLVSANTTVTYRHSNAAISMYSGDVYYDTTGNALYIYEYSVYYGSDIFNRRISTGCTIYGEIS